jgi:hypothetical protein
MIRNSTGNMSKRGPTLFAVGGPPEFLVHPCILIKDFKYILYKNK